MAIGSIFSRLKFWKRTPDSSKCEESPEYHLANQLKRYEKYVYEIQSIILWDNPTASALNVLFVNILFWLLVSLQWRFYGVLSSVFLAMCVHDAWTSYVWPEIRMPEASESPPDTPAHPSLVALSKAVTVCYTRARQYLICLSNLRREHPGLFCWCSLMVCGGLWCVGHWVSGLQLIYTLLMAALLGPGLYIHCVPPAFTQTFAQHVVCVQSAFAKYSNDASDDEYMPVTTSEDLALLTKVSDLHHDTYDSLTNPGSSSEMASGIGLMPSHEEDSLATLSDLEPINQLPLDPDESDSNPDDHQIQFQSGHFNGDSSSDEDAFSRDLEFSERDETDSVAFRGLSSIIAQAVTSNLASSVSVLANVIRPQQQPTARRTRRTDTDSDLDDFVIINRDELNHQDSS